MARTALAQRNRELQANVARLRRRPVTVNLASDANERFVLRGTLDPVRRGPVRMISLIAD